MERKVGLGSDELVDAFKEMTLIELSEFVQQFEDTFGVTAAAPVAVAAAPAAGGAASYVDELGADEVDVILERAGDKKIHVIKEVRALTSLGLKEAKDLVEGAPTPVLQKVDRQVAARAQKALVGAGAAVFVSTSGSSPTPREMVESHGGDAEFLRAVRKQLLGMLSDAEVKRALEADERTLRDWLDHPSSAVDPIGVRLSGLLEVASAFLEMWDSDLFASWLFDSNAHLDGATPADMIALGKASVLIEVLDESAFGVYA